MPKYNVKLQLDDERHDISLDVYQRVESEGDHSEAADEKPHDFLLQLCAGEAQWLVDTPALCGRCFEAWRLLTARYSPCGGQYEPDAMLTLLQRKAVSSAA